MNGWFRFTACITNKRLGGMIIKMSSQIHFTGKSKNAERGSELKRIRVCFFIKYLTKLRELFGKRFHNDFGVNISTGSKTDNWNIIGTEPLVIMCGCVSNGSTARSLSSFRFIRSGPCCFQLHTENTLSTKHSYFETPTRG